MTLCVMADCQKTVNVMYDSCITITLQLLCTNWNVLRICRLSGWFESGAATEHFILKMRSFHFKLICSKVGSIVGVFPYSEVILFLCVFYVSETLLVQCSIIQSSSLWKKNSLVTNWRYTIHSLVLNAFYTIHYIVLDAFYTIHGTAF